MQVQNPEFDQDLILKNLTFLQAARETKHHLEKGASKITIFTMNKEQSNKLKKNHRRNNIAKKSRRGNR